MFQGWHLEPTSGWRVWARASSGNQVMGSGEGMTDEEIVDKVDESGCDGHLEEYRDYREILQDGQAGKLV